MPQRSTSSMTKEILLGLAEGTPFLVREIVALAGEKFPDVPFSHHGCGGMITKLRDLGALELLPSESQDLRYQVINRDLLEGCRVRETAGRGSVLGRGDGAHRRAKGPPSKQAPRERLLELAESLFALAAESLFALAAEMESMQSPLGEFGSEELLRELARRMKKEGA